MRGRSETAVFIDLGDQFLQFSLGKTQDADGRRHFGLVVDDRAAVLILETWFRDPGAGVAP